MFSKPNKFSTVIVAVKKKVASEVLPKCIECNLLMELMLDIIHENPKNLKYRRTHMLLQN